MENEKQLTKWNVGHSPAGLLLSSGDFFLQLSHDKIDALIAILTSGEIGSIYDQDGNPVLVEPTEDSVKFNISEPDGSTKIIELPLEDFTEEADSLHEGITRAYKRVGSRIKRGFRVTSGPRKGEIVTNRATAYKPLKPAKTRMKLSRAAVKTKFIRAMKSKVTRKKATSLRLRRMNDTL